MKYSELKKQYEELVYLSQDDYVKLRSKVTEQKLQVWLSAFHKKVAGNCRKIINSIYERYESDIRQGVSYKDRVAEFDKQQKRIASHSEAERKHLELANIKIEIPEYEYWLTEKTQMQTLLRNPYMFIIIHLNNGKMFYEKK